MCKLFSTLYLNHYFLFFFLVICIFLFSSIPGKRNWIKGSNTIKGSKAVLGLGVFGFSLAPTYLFSVIKHGFLILVENFVAFLFFTKGFPGFFWIRFYFHICHSINGFFCFLFFQYIQEEWLEACSSKSMTLVWRKAFVFVFKCLGLSYIVN